MTCPDGFSILYGSMSDNAFYDESSKVNSYWGRGIECYFFCEMKLNFLPQDLKSCANLCQKNGMRSGQRRLYCCNFEWSKSEQRCRLHENCLKSYTLHKKDFFTCRKRGDFIIMLLVFSQLTCFYKATDVEEDLSLLTEMLWGGDSSQ